ncbi:MAG: YkgJ family cysteine cluster protein [Desulfobulbaceae bacterium]|nr:YkgJ family cysteine cluster protein [Desulfobulbaceae bacterium]
MMPPTQAPIEPAEARDYAELTMMIDLAMARSVRHHRQRLRCRPGCSGCCKSFSVLGVEAAAIERALARLAADALALIRSRADREEECPFLLDSLCAIYHHRPLICRSQGLAVAYIDHQRQAIEVSACPLNFPDDFPFAEEDLFFMDPFNHKLVELNRDFCAKNGLRPEERVTFKKLAATPVAPDTKQP